MTFRLEKMIDIKRNEIPDMESIIKDSPGRNRPVYKLKDFLNGRINIITELKHSSPSAGNLTGELDDTEIVRQYIAGGASAVSVLAEKEYFNGSYDHIKSVSSSCDRPVLCKDFIYFEEQIEAAYCCGADSVLLISRILNRETMHKLYNKTLSFGMTPLVEIHHVDEIDNIIFLDPEIVLVNMRNLETLEMKFETGIETLKKLPKNITSISASGISSAGDILYIMNESGTNSFLIGSSLMKSGNPGEVIMEYKNVH